LATKKILHDDGSSFSRKDAVPAVGEIKDRHGEHGHWVVCWPAAKDLRQRALGIRLGLFGLHFRYFVLLERFPSLGLPSTKRSRDFSLPLSREETKVAAHIEDARSFRTLARAGSRRQEESATRRGLIRL
jgi:hypothetical protein